ncbi:MAG: hypothetical protein ACYS72_04285, partial [Planctomycetota bacterium]
NSCSSTTSPNCSASPQGWQSILHKENFYGEIFCEQIEQGNRRPHLITCSPAHLIKCSVFGLSAKNGEGGDYASASLGKILFLNVAFPEDVFKYFSRRRAVVSDLTAI